MKVVSVIATKGGCGKSTISTNLAITAQLNGMASVVIDLDPQGSASEWNKFRAKKNITAPPMQAVFEKDLEQALEVSKKHGADIVFIDTPPQAESSALTAAEAADIVLIPVSPSMFDQLAVRRSLQIARIAGTKTMFVGNMIGSHKNASNDMLNDLSHYKLGIMPTMLVKRTAYTKCLTWGLGVGEYEKKGKAAHEVNSLLTDVCSQLH